MTTNHPEAGEKIFKKGEVIYQQGDYVTAIFDVLWGQVALYVDYHKPTQRLLNEVEADGFFGIVGFLESRPQNATAVALEKTACMVITHESFSHYFQERPAKIMSLMPVSYTHLDVYKRQAAHLRKVQPHHSGLRDCTPHAGQHGL